MHLRCKERSHTAVLFISFRAPGLRQNRGPRTGSELLSTGVPLEPQYDWTSWCLSSAYLNYLMFSRWKRLKFSYFRMSELLFRSSLSDMCCKVVHWLIDRYIYIVYIIISLSLSLYTYNDLQACNLCTFMPLTFVFVQLVLVLLFLLSKVADFLPAVDSSWHGFCSRSFQLELMWLWEPFGDYGNYCQLVFWGFWMCFFPSVQWSILKFVRGCRYHRMK